MVLLLALGVLGGVYTAFAPGSSADETTDTAIAVREGEKLYLKGCITCHGSNLQGVKDRGPSLVGVGPASVEFQVGTGRMPVARQEAQISRKPPAYNAEQTTQLAAYVQTFGGGPEIPAGNLRGDAVEGGRLFRVNCAQCHAFSANGGALSSGKYAPSMEKSTDREIYAAMLSAPQNMPAFGDSQLTPDEKRDVIAYVQSLKADRDPGGFGIGRSGPVPEGLIIFVVGIVGLLFATLWIAGKS